jgi:hypothetical protein
MATIYKIHPAIGIARLGNSPSEFFVGPEHRGERPEPPGGFKDGECRVKRQAARFRIFAHHDDGSVQEITAAQAEITWTVHLANRKAPYPNRGNSESAADLSIDPGARSTSGPNQQQLFDTGSIRFAQQPAVTVPLGEMRTDADNRLLVLGGFGTSASPAGNALGHFWGNAGWYDDVSDGPVSATIELRGTSETATVVGAWVIVTPPKFAPHQDSITTLYDRVFQVMVDAGLAAAPTTTSYTRDIYPILQRARDIHWVYETRAHTWPDPVFDPALRSAIFDRLRPPGDMPLLNNADSALTPVQRAHMQRWRDDAFTRDWQGVPSAEANASPEGMDRAALDAAVGGSFFPGIEAGGLDEDNRPILAPGNYADAFRIDHARVTAGTISASMALPWQADFLACADNWWPVPRPNRVIPQGSSAYENWDRGLNSYADMVAHWHTLGFVVRQGVEHVEVGRCSTAPSAPSLRPLVTGKVARPPAILQRRTVDLPEKR